MDERGMASPRRVGDASLRSSVFKGIVDNPLNSSEFLVRSAGIGVNIIIAADPDEVERLVRRVGTDSVVVFASLEELDRWRERRLHDDETFGPDLVAALEELGAPLPALPRKLRMQLERMTAGAHVPRLRALEAHWPSRRSFYRVWNEAIAETPSAFLRRLRARHAERLMAMGRSRKEAAHRAGFSSVDQMRRNLGK
jgi:AraC-like DNA-binding protein